MRNGIMGYTLWMKIEQSIVKEANKDVVLFLIACVCVAGSVLVFDLGQQLGVAGGVPYVLLVLLSLFKKRISIVVGLAILATALTLLGFHFSSMGGEVQQVLINRWLALLVIWSVAVAVMVVVVQRQRLEAQIDRDPLTGLYNRNYLVSNLQREISISRREAIPLSVIMMDIDHFKAVNDSYGHSAGDRVIRRVANICMATIRGTDWVCRYGGEEFVIILPNADQHSAAEVAERLRHSIDETPFAVGSGKASITVSLGLAQYAAEHSDVAALLEAADKAMYTSKREGRNRVKIHAPDNFGGAQPV